MLSRKDTLQGILRSRSYLPAKRCVKSDLQYVGEGSEEKVCSFEFFLSIVVPISTIKTNAEHWGLENQSYDAK